MTGTAKEAIFEFRRVGRSVRVSVMDPDSLTEAVIAGPSSAGEEALKRAAMDKLRYILAKDTNS